MKDKREKIKIKNLESFVFDEILDEVRERRERSELNDKLTSNKKGGK